MGRGNDSIAIFLDASFLYAYMNDADIHHGKALKIFQELAENKYGETVTSDYIFDEAVTVTSRKAGRQTAINLGNFILNSEIVLIKISNLLIEKSWELFQKTDGLSFTDCTNISLMQTFRINNIATFDKSFSQIEGIIVIGQ